MKKNLIEVREENEGAFTLIELLVVILIIGILAAIAIPVFLNQRKAAVDAAVKSDVKNAATQVESWAVANPAKNVPGVTVTANAATLITSPDSNGATTVDPPLNEIKTSQGTTLTLEKGATAGSYKITGKNTGGADSAKADGIVYNSAAGGLQQPTK